MTINQEVRRSIALTLRYKFNATKSKYKGTGAGESQKSRMCKILFFMEVFRTIFHGGCPYTFFRSLARIKEKRLSLHG
ncbi:hypothetical protein [uncultured Phocaeicola sp.]|uniref:hypothetical protein n=1 Tax=uncultured Phocaeicola sp. TaxID=990718 RepID=UPI0015B0760F|nr:hypothetical protein [uncultured Phocaeicola sp.]